MVSLVAIPLDIGHDVDTVDNDPPVEELAPVLPKFHLCKSHWQLVSLTNEHFGVVGDGLAEVDILTISLVEDQSHASVSSILIVHHEDKKDILF